MHEINITAHGIMVGVDVAVQIILKELEVLNKRDIDVIDHDTLSMTFFNRSIIEIKLSFCLTNIGNVIKAIENDMQEQDKSALNFCVIISEKIKELQKSNSETLEKIAAKLSSTGNASIIFGGSPINATKH
jgi:hypothetical protein